MLLVQTKGNQWLKTVADMKDRNLGSLVYQDLEPDSGLGS